jgi:SNF2 family DNA or RNA helicase
MKTATPRSLPSKPRWTPHKYQLKAAKFLVERGGAGLLLDPGLGKTSITLAAWQTLHAEGVSHGALILAPLRPAQQVWPEEINGWADFASIDYVVLHGKDKERLVSEKHAVYIINYEGLKWLVESGHLTRLLKQCHIDTLVLDELSKMKNTASKRFKMLKPFLPKFARRWGLTGSPASNGLMDIFGQIYALDCGRSLGPYITHYRQQYFVPKGDYDWRIREGAESEIYERVKPVVLRMAGEDYLDLPVIMNHIHKIDLPPAARKLYKIMEDELLADMDAGRVVAANEAVASGKCRQIASGALYLPKHDPVTGAPLGGGWELVHDAKLDALEDLLDELQGQPMLCGYEFKHDIERIVARLGPKTPWIGGGVNVKVATQHIADWNANQLPVLFGHPASIGHGLNAQKGNAAHVGFFTVPWDFELYDQFIRRVRRQGNKAQHVHVHHFVARGTIEEARVIVALRQKDRTQQKFFEALRDELSTRKSR